MDASTIYKIPTLDEYQQILGIFESSINIMVVLAILVAILLLRFKPAQSIAALPIPSLRITMLIALIARLPRFATSLWYDETFTSALAQLNLHDLLATSLADVHPPLHYLMTSAVGRIIGFSDVALRLPSLVAGVMLIYVVYRIVAQIQSRQVALACALVIAILPPFVHYSAEARYPIWLALCVMIGILAIIEHRPRIFIVAVIATGWLHATGIFYVMALVISWYVQRRRLLFCVGVLLAGWSWLPFVLMQMNNTSDFWLHRQNVFWLLIDGLVGRNQPAPAVILIHIMALALSFAGVWSLRKRLPSWWWCVAFVPVLPAIASLFISPIYLTRALLASSLVVVIAIVWMAYEQRLITLVLVLAIASYAGYQYQRSSIQMRDVVALCDGYDVIVSSVNMAFVAKHYSNQSVYLIGDGDNRHQALTDDAKGRLFSRITSTNEVESACWLTQISYATTEREYAILPNDQPTQRIYDNESLLEYQAWLIR